MKPTAAILSLFLLAGTSVHALAAATPEDAARVTAALQAYFGAEPGVVTVTPAGDSLALTIDLGPHIAKVKDHAVSASVTPIEMTLTDQGGGKWKVDQDQAFALKFNVEGAADISVNIGSIKGTGVYDEALGAFESSNTEIAQMALDETITDKGMTTKVAYTIGAIKVESQMAQGEGGADGTSKYTFTDLKETINVPAAPDGSSPPLDFTLSSPSGYQDVVMKGLRSKAVTELVAWFVANPSEELIKSKQAELKNKLRAALPLWTNMSGTASLDTLSVNTMLGQFGFDKADVYVTMNGILDEGYLQEKISLSGLQVPQGIVPPWATSLVPSHLTFDFNFSGFNLAQPARMIIDTLDLGKDPPLPEGFEQQLMGAFMPTMAVKIGLGPSEVVGPIYHLKAEGAMNAGPMSMPSGQATIMLKGIDELMAALQAAPPEMGMQQAAPVGIMAKGMAKTEADGFLSWKIESTPEGGVLINGTDVSKIGGGQ